MAIKIRKGFAESMARFIDESGAGKLSSAEGFGEHFNSMNRAFTDSTVIPYSHPYSQMLFAAYYWPRNFFKIMFLMEKIHKYLPEQVSIADLGGGQGHMELALWEIMSHPEAYQLSDSLANYLSRASFCFNFFEKSKQNIITMTKLLAHFGADISREGNSARLDSGRGNSFEIFWNHQTVRRLPENPQSFDLVMSINTLSEIFHRKLDVEIDMDLTLVLRKKIVNLWGSKLRTGGIFAIIEPGNIDKISQLRSLASDLSDEGWKNLYPCPVGKCRSFCRRCGAFEYRDVLMPEHYISIENLRKRNSPDDPVRRLPFSVHLLYRTGTYQLEKNILPEEKKPQSMASLNAVHNRVGARFDLVATVVGVFADRERAYRYMICDGTFPAGEILLREERSGQPIIDTGSRVLFENLSVERAEITKQRRKKSFECILDKNSSVTVLE